MLRRFLITGMKSSVPIRNFGFSGPSFSKGLETQTDHLYQPVLDLYTKRLRKIALDRSVLQKNKLIVPTLRLRQEEDTLEKLRNNSECAAVINAREEFEDIDFVLKTRQVNLINRRLDANVNSYYIQFGDELIRCTLESVTSHHLHHWLIQAKFNRYIPGRPNLIYLPFKMRTFDENFFIARGSDYAIKVGGLWCYSYNDDYPTTIEIDPISVSPGCPYKIGDVVNKFPDGLELHPKHKKELGREIVSIKVTNDILVDKEKELLEFRRKLKSGYEIVEEEIIEELMPEDPKERERRLASKARSEVRKAKAREKAKNNPRSMKKRVALMDFKIRDDLDIKISVDTKPGKKGGGGPKEE